MLESLTSAMATAVNLTKVRQSWDGVTLLPGVETDIPDELAARLYGQPGYRVAFGVVKPLRDEQGWHILWKSPFSVSDGYAVAAEHTLAAMVKAGVDVRAQSCWFKYVEGLNGETVRIVDGPRNGDGAIGYQVGVMLAVPTYFNELPTPYRIGWTMWETTDPLVQAHPDWPGLCSRVNQLWVPTAWQVPVFEKFFRGPVQTVPLAINPRYKFMARPVRETFTVVAWGAMTSRKSPHETVEVFQKAFPIERYPHCRLRIKTKCGLFGDVLSSVPDFADPRIEVYDGVWMVDDMIGFLYDADCALILPRGEGFGMPAREAIATGLPTILAEHSGHLEVCDQRYTWPVRTARMERSSMGGEWWTPDWDQAVDLLRWVHDNRKIALARAELGADWFEETWGQRAIGQRILAALERVDCG